MNMMRSIKQTLGAAAWALLLVTAAALPARADAQPAPEPGLIELAQAPPGNGAQFQLRYSDAEIKAVLDKLKKADPTFYNELQQIKKQMPGEYQMIVGDMIEQDRNLARLKTEDPEMYKMQMQIAELERKERDLSRKYRDSKTDADKMKVEKELRTVLDKLFDMHLKQRQREVENLEKELKKIKAEIDKRKKNKTAIIEKHFGDITGTNQGLEW